MAYVKLDWFTQKAMYLGARIRSGATVVEVPKVLARTSRILVCAPRSQRDFSAAVDFARQLREVLPGAEVLLAHRGDIGVTESATEHVEATMIPAEDINLLGLPKKHVVEKWRAREWDLAIDLSIEFDILNTQLCRKSGAALKVCLYHPQRDPFYNIQVRTAASMSPEERYGAVLRCLRALLPHPLSQPQPEVLPT